MKKMGFTLIELIVVVAIILLLVGILAPKLRKEVAKARDAKAVAALGSVRTAAKLILTNKGYVPIGFMGSDSGNSYYLAESSTSSDYLENNLLNYLNTTATMTESNTHIIPTGGQSDLTNFIFGGDVTMTIDATEGDVSFIDPSYADYDTKENAWASY
jgi:prepilin-type N-terminal cleavage/methylation domain-containing protein